MKQIGRVVANGQARFGTLKLMLLHKTSERMLANALGATNEITIFFVYHAIPYKYDGRLRVQNILSSAQYVMNLLPEEHLIKFLNTAEELKSFLTSTDKAVLLFEFCGWSPRLLAEEKNNVTAHSFGDIRKTNGSLLVEEMRKQKVMKYYKMTCSVFKGMSGLPWLTDFTNECFLPEVETSTPESSSVCNIDDLQRLEYFLPKFMNLAREFFLPPERIRFGLVSERSMLEELNIEASDSWLIILHTAGCPGCSKVLRENDDLKLLLQNQGSLVRELENDVHDLLPTLPANMPSMLLFVDRSSDSLSIRKQSKNALDAFRELALHHQPTNWTHEQSKGPIAKGSPETNKALRASKHPRLDLLPATQNAYVKDKMSLTIMKDGKQIVLDKFIPNMQDSSLHEILALLIQQKKDLKLSKVAKDAGFQLLSEDFIIKGTEASTSLPDSKSDQTLVLPSDEVSETTFDLGYDERLQTLDVSSNEVSESTLDLDNDQKLQSDNASVLGIDEGSSVNDVDSLRKGSEKCLNAIEQSAECDSVKTNEQLPVLSQSQSYSILTYAKDNKFEDMFVEAEQQKQQRDSSASFFFCDGNFRLLKALTGGSKIPSVVIIDPLMVQHFVLSEPAVYNHSVLSDFLEGFLNGSLTPYQQSEISVPSLREAPTPPFVNLDFHEADSIPRVTIHTFTELVLGNQSNSGNTTDAWNRDVLVLFSNNWCGFCQRMELVVRELHRAIRGYSIMLKNGSERIDNQKNSTFPLFYMMDCTLNDCRWILKSLVEREVYPHLLLFPAGSKNAIIYEGDFSVSRIVKFLVDCGALVWEKGIPLAGDHQRGNISKLAPVSQITYHEVLLKERLQKTAAENGQITDHFLTGPHETNPKVVCGSILSATDKLLNAHPFSESKILVVKADENTGFQGLIFNKHLNWNSLQELEDGLQLLKEAPLSYGGPVMEREMPLVALCRHPEKDQGLEVLPGMYFLDQMKTIKLLEELKVGRKSVHGYWFFVGFSSWGWDQLFDEIAEGAWDVWEGNIEQLGWPEVL